MREIFRSKQTLDQEKESLLQVKSGSEREDKRNDMIFVFECCCLCVVLGSLCIAPNSFT